MRWIFGLLLLASLAVAGLTAGDTDTRMALVIGNGAYRHVAPLANPRNDAEAVSAKLDELDFSVSTVVDSDLEAIRAALDAFEQQSEGADVALVFYAGHGLQVAGENYLLPVDARIERPEDLRSASLRVTELHDALAAAGPGLAVLILDACRDNPFVDVVSGSQGLASGSVFGGTSEQARSSDVLIAFAAAPGAVAADGKDGNSPFTTALLQWIDQPGLEIGTMFRRVRQTVVELTAGAQVPWVEESLLQDVYLSRSDPLLVADATRAAPFDVALLSTIRAIENPTERQAAFAFYDRLVPESGIAGVEELQATRASLDAGEEDAFVQESMIWLSIRDSVDPEIFTAFLDRFPDSAFVDLARLRLAALAEPDPLIGDVAQLSTPVLADTPTLILDPAAGPEGLRPEPPGSLAAPGTGLTDASAAPSLPLSPAEAEAALALDGPQRAAVQRLLAGIGHYSGGMDGSLGPMSRAAIAAFQGAEGLPSHGHADRATLLRLTERAASPTLAAETSPELRLGIHGIAAIALRGAGAEPETIRIASIERHPDMQNTWRGVADAFERDHPGTTVAFDYQPGPAYKRNLLVMLGSTTPPDIFFTWGGGHLSTMSEAGFVRDLTPDLAEGWAMSFKPGALKNLVTDGRVFAVPSQMSLVSFYANATHLASAGVDPRDFDSWDGLVASVDRLRAAGFVPLAVGAAERWPLQFYWGGLAEAIGGPEAIANAAQGVGQGFASEPFLLAGEHLRELAAREPFQPGFRDATAIDAVDAVARGEASLVLTGDWSIPRMTRNWPGGPSAASKELVRIPFPPRAMSPEGPVTYGGTDAWVVRTDAPPQAVELLKRLASVETQAALARLGLAVPSIPGADAEIALPFLRDIATDLTNSRHHQLFLDQELGPEAGEVVNDVALALLDGDLSPSRAAAEVEAAWTRVRGARGATAPAEMAPAD